MASKEPTADLPLARELAAFERDREHLVKEHEGNFALYKGDKFHGSFSTFQLAYQEGVRLFKLEPFLVKEILKDEKPEKFPALTFGLLRGHP